MRPTGFSALKPPFPSHSTPGPPEQVQAPSVIDLMTRGPAKVLASRRTLAGGAAADICLFDLDEAWPYDARNASANPQFALATGRPLPAGSRQPLSTVGWFSTAPRSSKCGIGPSTFAVVFELGLIGIDYLLWRLSSVPRARESLPRPRAMACPKRVPALHHFGHLRGHRLQIARFPLPRAFFVRRRRTDDHRRHDVSARHAVGHRRVSFPPFPRPPHCRGAAARPLHRHRTFLIALPVLAAVTLAWQGN